MTEDKKEEHPIPAIQKAETDVVMFQNVNLMTVFLQFYSACPISVKTLLWGHDTGGRASRSTEQANHGCGTR